MMRGIRDRAQQTRRDQVHTLVEHTYRGDSDIIPNAVSSNIDENSSAIGPGQWDDDDVTDPSSRA